MRPTILAAALLLAAAPAQADTVKARYLSGNGDCQSFGAEITTGAWTFDAHKVGHSGMSWPLINGAADVRMTHQGYGVAIVATVTGNILTLEAPRWGCKWAAER